MFREMRRNKQLLPDAVSREILERNTSGVLSLMGDDGYPYGVPLSYVLVGDKLFFHCAKTGHKIDAIKACDKASYCVYDEGYRKEGEWALNIKSVVTFGRIRLVEDEDTARKICTELVRKFTDDQDYLEKELQNAFPRVQCLELIPEHMTGKLINES